MRSTRLARLAVVLVAILAGLVIALAIDLVRLGGPQGWLAARGWAPPYDAQGELVDIGGRRLYLDCRGAGAPTVVLENGLGSGAAGWGSVLPAIAERTRTCAYDRAGLGRSDPPAGRGTVGSAVEDLRALLAAAGERPPYVLVGMSLGGSHVRVFADRHRDEVVGIVLVDAFMPDVEQPSAARLDRRILADWTAALEATRASIEAVESLDWPASVAEVAATDLTGLPVEVVNIPQELRIQHELLSEADRRRLTDEWRAWIMALSPGRTTLTIAERSGHIIQLDRPDLVIAAIERLVDAGRAGRAG